MSNYKSYPLLLQLIHFSCALPILADYLSVLWSVKSVSSNIVPSTITLYQMSTSCNRVMEAVNQVSSEHYGPIPTIFNNKHHEQEVLTSRLSPVVLNNRLDKSHL
ncbi:hypothetical protein BDZ94DRAFT_1272154 [Collybia nuda]|uniref:Uncharacterized protein n=1 Tax=Collybia nuda TaxID=64659 RepID=A0A9P5XWE8_9AGAR|nr:hypothetical protein BDZ94DRAFT_1272154 [Collybia nuda]